MAATAEADRRTRAFARVIGPYVAVITGDIALRQLTNKTFLDAFYINPVTVWETGAMLLLMGLIVIAFHQYWSRPTAVLVSLVGWVLALRGLALLWVPHFYETATSGVIAMTTPLRAGFGLLTLIGLWLTYAGWFARPAPTAPV